MIKRDYYMTRRDDVKLYKTYSDENYYIIQDQTGFKYAFAIDVESSNYTYTETQEKIELPEQENEEVQDNE